MADFAHVLDMWLSFQNKLSVRSRKEASVGFSFRASEVRSSGSDVVVVQ